MLYAFPPRFMMCMIQAFLNRLFTHGVYSQVKKYIYIKIYILGMYLKHSNYMKYIRYKYIRYLKKHDSFDKQLKNWHTLWQTKLKNGTLFGTLACQIEKLARLGTLAHQVEKLTRLCYIGTFIDTLAHKNQKLARFWYVSTQTTPAPMARMARDLENPENIFNQ